MMSLITQPARLAVPSSTRSKFRILFIADAVVLAVSVVIAGASLTFAEPARMIGVSIGAFFALPAIIGFGSGIPHYLYLNRVERDRGALLFARQESGFVVLTPGPKPRGSRDLVVVPGSVVNVDVAPDLGRSLFYVVVALKWSITSGGRTTSFATYFEPDPAFFDEVKGALASVGLTAVFTYRPLSHGVMIQDM